MLRGAHPMLRGDTTGLAIGRSQSSRGILWEVPPTLRSGSKNEIADRLAHRNFSVCAGD